MSRDVEKSFEQRIGAYVGAKRLLLRHAPVLVALSGGADSVALLAVLDRLGFDVRAAHCNFHLRGEESMRDMRFAQELCGRLGVDLYVRDFDVAGYVRRTGDSLEMACRDLRYRWFGELLDRDGAQAVAVGHHREDRAETFMLNLMRGAGIAGLTSMLPRSGNVVRPLLEVSRGDIEEYLQARGLGFITDSSNASDAHRRNRIRNRVFPLLEELFPGAVDSVLRTIANLERQRTLLDASVRESTRNYSKDGAYNLLRIVEESPCPEGLLFEMIRDKGFNFSQATDMIDHYSDSGQKFLSSDGKVLAEINRGILAFTDAAASLPYDGCCVVNPRHDIVSPVHIAVTRHPVEIFRPERRGAAVAYFDASLVDTDHRWMLRRYRRGDRMVPFGMHGSKLVSDIFAGAKLSAEQKRNVWLMTCDDEIVWIPGLRNSAFGSVGPETRQFIRMVYMPSAE